MKIKNLSIIIFVLAATVLLSEAGDTTLRSLWASPAYSVKSFPDLWRPKKFPPPVRDVEVFKKFDIKSNGISITNFVSHYGIPDRYLISNRKNGQNFLIYDLPSGYNVALYVHEPPYDTFKAIVIIDSAGDLVRLIK